MDAMADSTGSGGGVVDVDADGVAGLDAVLDEEPPAKPEAPARLLAAAENCDGSPASARALFFS